MAAAGLRSDALAVEQGVAAIRGWVTEGRREITRAELEAEIARRSLHGGESRATLMVNAIDRMPWADGATVSLDWVDHLSTRATSRRRWSSTRSAPGKISPSG